MRNASRTDFKQTDRIIQILSNPTEERTEKMCLELMSYTKVNS